LYTYGLFALYSRDLQIQVRNAMKRLAIATINYAARTRNTLRQLFIHAPLKQRYVTSEPDPGNAVDIFKGAWSSRLPPPLDRIPAGQSPLFDDERIHWFIKETGSVKDRSALDLGPLEGGHSYMLERMGAGPITAVEANTHAYLRCLIVKELLHLERVEFLCGDFIEYLRRTERQFDLCIASGVLYHMRDPAELIRLLGTHCTGSIFLWTHYFDAERIAGSPLRKFIDTRGTPAEHAGFHHTLHCYTYQQRSDWSTFCGGSAPYSHWMSRHDLMECLAFFGFRNVRINFDTPEHPNGPALALVASR
jgi:hypothetical protein